MASRRLAASHYPNQSPEQCRHWELYAGLYVVIRLKLVNFKTSLMGQLWMGLGARVHNGQQATVCPDTRLHNVQQASAWPDTRVRNVQQATA